MDESVKLYFVPGCECRTNKSNAENECEHDAAEYYLCEIFVYPFKLYEKFAVVIVEK